MLLRFAIALLFAAASARAFTVERSVSSANPTILSWEFFQSPGEACDSVEIIVKLKPGLAVTARVLSWPQSGPWAGTRPVLDGDSAVLRIRAWRGGPPAAGAAAIATLSLELREGATTRFEDAETSLEWNGFGGSTVAARAAPPARAEQAPSPEGERRDALGRYQPILKWRRMASTMRGADFPSP